MTHSPRIQAFLDSIAHLPADLVAAVHEWVEHAEDLYGSDQSLLEALRAEIAEECERRQLRAE